MEHSDATEPAAIPAAADVADTPVSTGRPVRRRRWILLTATGAFVGALIVSGLVAGTSQPSSPDPSSTPRAAPEFQLPDLRDPAAHVSLGDFDGRPVVVNFWASWCVPCRKEMPAFEAVYQKVKDSIAFVGINHEDSRGDALAFLRKTGVRYPVGYDPDGKTATDYGLLGIPTTIFIDAQGREVDRHLGEITERDLEQRLNRLFPTK